MDFFAVRKNSFVAGRSRTRKEKLWNYGLGGQVLLVALDAKVCSQLDHKLLVFGANALVCLHIPNFSLKFLKA